MLKMLKNVLQICAFVGVLNSYKVAAVSISAEVQQPLKWAVDVLQDRVSVSALKETEPGFDLTEEEINKFKIWRHGIIPYFIDELSFDKVLRDRIRSFLDVTGSLTGLHFLEMASAPTDLKTRWVLFLNRRGLLGCADHSITNFTNEGVQKVVLGYDCMTSQAELAEVVLVLAGVPHQHNAPDREEHITVNFEKISPDKHYLFEKLGDTDWLFHDIEYDFTSASHYHFHKHTVDGSATITPKVSHVFVGEGDGFSYSDILKIRMLYNYITRKKNRIAKAPECKKLFKLGSGYKKSESDVKENVEPRKKPNRYLGLADNDNIDENDDLNNNDIDDQNNDDENNEEDNEEINEGNNEDNNEDNNEENDQENNEDNNEENYDENNENNNEDINGDNNEENNEDDNVDNNEDNNVDINEENNDGNIDAAGILSAGLEENNIQVKEDTVGTVEDREGLSESWGNATALKSQVDPLSYLSDYGTDDGKKKKLRNSVTKLKTRNKVKKI